jgi:hypothetical protein
METGSIVDRGRDHYGRFPRDRMSAEFIEHRPAAEVGHHHIKQHQIGPDFTNEFGCTDRGWRAMGIISSLDEDFAEQFRDRLLIFDDNNGRVRLALSFVFRF